MKTTKGNRADIRKQRVMEDLVINQELSTGMPMWLRPDVIDPDQVLRHHRFFSTGVVFSGKVLSPPSPFLSFIPYKKGIL
jgi:hypothetical protein